MKAIDCFIVAAVAIYGQTVAWAADQVSQPSDGTTAAVVSSSSRPVSPVRGGITLPVPRVGDSCTYSGKDPFVMGQVHIVYQVMEVKPDGSFITVSIKDQEVSSRTITPTPTGFRKKGSGGGGWYYWNPHTHVYTYSKLTKAYLAQPAGIAVSYAPVEFISAMQQIGRVETTVTVKGRETVVVLAGAISALRVEFRHRFIETGSTAWLDEVVWYDSDSQCIAKYEAINNNRRGSLFWSRELVAFQRGAED